MFATYQTKKKAKKPTKSRVLTNTPNTGTSPRRFVNSLSKCAIISKKIKTEMLTDDVARVQIVLQSLVSSKIKTCDLNLLSDQDHQF